MKNVRMTICFIAAVLFIVADEGLSLTEFKDGGTHNISNTINDDVWVDYQTPGMNTTFNLLAGGDIPYHYVLSGYADSRLNISGGSSMGLTANDRSQIKITDGYANYLYAYDSSQMIMSGGYVDVLNVNDNSKGTISSGEGFQFCADDNGKIIMSGGSVYDLYAFKNSQVEMSGGVVNGSLVASEDGTVIFTDGSVNTIYASGNGRIIVSGGSIIHDHLWLENNSELIINGSNFAIDGSPIGFTEITGLLGGFYQDEPYRVLTGTLANGDIINNQFQIGNTASIVLVPEPATLLLLGFGAFMISKRK